MTMLAGQRRGFVYFNLVVTTALSDTDRAEIAYQLGKIVELQN